MIKVEHLMSYLKVLDMPKNCALSAIKSRTSKVKSSYNHIPFYPGRKTTNLKIHGIFAWLWSNIEKKCDICCRSWINAINLLMPNFFLSVCYLHNKYDAFISDFVWIFFNLASDMFWWSANRCNFLPCVIKKNKKILVHDNILSHCMN